ncbi:unnamed protein product [Calypogeia fissa]
MDQRLSIEDAEGVGKGLTHVGMTPRAMTVKYKGQPFVIENRKLATFFRVPRPFDGEAPLKYPKPTISYEEAREFLKEEGDFSQQWEKKKVNFGSISNEERRCSVELVVKWVLVKAGYHNITIDHLAIAKALLEGTLHPLQVWKEGMKHSIRPKGLSSFPSLVNYVASNVFSAIRLDEGENSPAEEDNQEERRREEGQGDEEEEGESSPISNRELRNLREELQDKRVRLGVHLNNSDEELSEGQSSEPVYFEARRLTRAF